ncbi:TolB family protein [Pyxidicoccus sp. MSG2]|uniref:TolB family protein n=1 Tax=Pyxidicoccus sp. MSG2 TaxID=2996790 RepID=UPI00226F0894|nr:Xaa-Pro aminopeptidase [Pyxidicoccus sp. MSG2]MCY1018059.1 Xaa-Pro aminopeptidase [Pyxidicoccus sp. MSG2]
MPQHPLLTSLVLSALLVGCHASSSRTPRETHAPEIYGAGLFTTGAWDFFLAFSPDQKRVLFCRADEQFEQYEIFETRLGEDGHWSTPVKPRFATEWSNADPHIAPDGRSVFFISNRPHPGETAARATHDLWVASLQADDEWGEATRLPSPVNDANTDEWSPAVAANGNLYFGAERPGTHGDSDLWVSRLVDGVYQPPENLGDAINTRAAEVEPWIAPDERYLLFSALRRADGVGSYDLYVSQRLPGGGWEKARLLGGGINSPDRDFNQSVSPDGKWLYFSSNRPHAGDVDLGARFDHPRNDAALVGIGKGTGDIYRVPMSALGL